MKHIEHLFAYNKSDLFLIGTVAPDRMDLLRNCYNSQNVNKMLIKEQPTVTRNSRPHIMENYVYTVAIALYVNGLVAVHIHMAIDASLSHLITSPSLPLVIVDISELLQKSGLQFAIFTSRPETWFSYILLINPI